MIKKNRTKNGRFKKGCIPDNIDAFLKGGKKTRFRKGHSVHPNSGKYKRTNKIKNKIRKKLLGFKHTEETKKKISKLKKGKPIKGNGSLPFLKLKVKERDNYICQDCGYKEKDIMVVDHIYPIKFFPELKFDLENLRTLCPNCHARKTIWEKKNYKNYQLYNNVNYYEDW